jgi:hypothetical protein
LYANAQRSKELQLFEGPGVGAADGSFIAVHQVQARAVREALERIGEVILGVVFAIDVREEVFDVIDAGLDFVGEEGGLDYREAAQAPAGGGHGFDQLDFDGAGGGEFIEICIDETLEIVARFIA